VLNARVAGLRSAKSGGPGDDTKGTLVTPRAAVTMVVTMKPHDAQIAKARRLARKLLRKELPERWVHTQGVATRATELAQTVAPEDRSLLVAASWLHDIGYASAVQNTGCHPLDGGLYLRAKGWPDRLAALVAHHSGARFVPVERGFGVMMGDFDFEDDAVADALTYADQTVGPNGRRMTVPYRIAEAITRHGPDSPNARARVDRVPYLLAVADRVERRLAASRGAPTGDR